MAEASATKDKNKEKAAREQEELENLQRQQENKARREIDREQRIEELEQKIAEKQAKEAEEEELRRLREEEDKDKEKEKEKGSRERPREERREEKEEDLRKQIKKLKEKVEGEAKKEAKTTSESADRYVRNVGKSKAEARQTTESADRFIRQSQRPSQSSRIPRSINDFFKKVEIKIPRINLPGIGGIGGGTIGGAGGAAGGIGGAGAGVTGASGAAATGGAAGGAAAGAGAGAAGSAASGAAGGAAAAGAATAGTPVGWIILGVVAAVVLIVVIVVVIIIVGPILFNAFEDALSQTPVEASDCSDIPSTFNNPDTIAKVNSNMSIYRNVARDRDVPWEMLVAIHNRESGNNAGADNPWQFDPRPPGVNVDDFETATDYAARFLNEKAIFGPVGRHLRADMDPGAAPDEESIKDAFWGYNGRADYHRQIAEALNYNPTTEGFEGSFYVMNRWDDERIAMEIRGTIDGTPINTTDARDGAWKIFILLKSADYNGNQIERINEVCDEVDPAVSGAAPATCPLVGTITTPYGSNIPGYGFGFHHGVDIDDAVPSSPIRTPISGTARLDGSDADPGGYKVFVSNGEYEVGFYHVQAGGRVTGNVNKGDTVAKKGNSGTWSTAAHLHYVVSKGGVEQNPLRYIPATLNFEIPPNDNYSGIVPANGVWGRCNTGP